MRRGFRANGTNPRALRTNPRAKARNKWALRNWKRTQRQKQTTVPSHPKKEDDDAWF
jgi:hypothetical protein